MLTHFSEMVVLGPAFKPASSLTWKSWVFTPPDGASKESLNLLPRLATLLAHSSTKSDPKTSLRGQTSMLQSPGDTFQPHLTCPSQQLGICVAAGLLGFLLPTWPHLSSFLSPSFPSFFLPSFLKWRTTVPLCPAKGHFWRAFSYSNVGQRSIHCSELRGRGRSICINPLRYSGRGMCCTSLQ